jgi:hypothetical protein
MRVRFGTRALTSLMTFGLAPASNDSSLTLNIVFSFGLEAASSAAASSAPAPPAAAPAGMAAPAVGKAISWMFRRVCEFIWVVVCVCVAGVCQKKVVGDSNDWVFFTLP